MKAIDEDPLLATARTIIERGGCSGATLEFLEDLVWFGWDSEDDQRDYQASRMRQIALLYQA
jgi:hypothetical protein